MLSSVALSAAPTGSTKDYSHSQSQLSSSGDKWPMYLELEGKKGNFRNIARLSWMAPLWQDDTSMLFGDIRLMMDNRHDREVNIGLGYRTICKDWDMGSEGVVLGAYAFFDRKKSTLGNKYNQGTFGVEALGDYFRFSGNYYMPQNKKHLVASRFNPTVVRSGWNVVDKQAVFTFNTLLNPTDDIERTLKGYDVELRGKVPVTDTFNIWGGIGAYRFSRDGLHRNGPMAMLDVEFLDGLGIDGSRASLGFEYRKDKGFKANRFGVLKLTTPLASVGKGKSYPSLTGVEYEMTRFILRDVDVQTGVETKESHRTIFASGTDTAVVATPETTTSTTTSGDMITQNSDGTYDIHVSGGLMQATYIRANHVSNDFPTAMMDLAKRTTEVPMLVFVGAPMSDGSGTPLKITEEDFERAYRGISQATDINPEAQWDIGGDLEEYYFPIPSTVSVVGMSNHGLDHAGITDAQLAEAVVGFGEAGPSLLNEFSNHIVSLPKDATVPALISEADPSTVIVDGGMNFAWDETSSFSVLSDVSLSARVHSEGGVQPAMVNVHTNSFLIGNDQSGKPRSVTVALGNSHQIPAPTGLLTYFKNADAYAALANRLRIDPVVVLGPDIPSYPDTSGVRLAGFQDDSKLQTVLTGGSQAQSVLAANKAPEIIFATVEVGGSSTPYAAMYYEGTSPKPLSMEWSLPTASDFVTFKGKSQIGSADTFSVAGLGGFTVTDTALGVITKYATTPLTALDIATNVPLNNPEVVDHYLWNLKEVQGEDLTVANVQSQLSRLSAEMGTVAGSQANYIPPQGAISIDTLESDPDVAGIMTIAINNSDKYYAELKNLLTSFEPGSQAVLRAGSSLVAFQVATAALARTTNGMGKVLSALTTDSSSISLVEDLLDYDISWDASTVEGSDSAKEIAIMDALNTFVVDVDPTLSVYQNVMRKVNTQVRNRNPSSPLVSVTDRLATGTGSTLHLSLDQYFAMSEFQELMLMGFDWSAPFIKQEDPISSAQMIKDVFTPSGASQGVLESQKGAFNGILTTDMSSALFKDEARTSLHGIFGF